MTQTAITIDNVLIDDVLKYIFEANQPLWPILAQVNKRWLRLVTECRIVTKEQPCDLRRAFYARLHQFSLRADARTMISIFKFDKYTICDNLCANINVPSGTRSYSFAAVKLLLGTRSDVWPPQIESILDAKCHAADRAEFLHWALDAAAATPRIMPPFLARTHLNLAAFAIGRKPPDISLIKKYNTYVRGFNSPIPKVYKWAPYLYRKDKEAILRTVFAPMQGSDIYTLQYVVDQGNLEFLMWFISTYRLDTYPYLLTSNLEICTADPLLTTYLANKFPKCVIRCEEVQQLMTSNLPANADPFTCVLRAAHWPHEPNHATLRGLLDQVPRNTQIAQQRTIMLRLWPKQLAWWIIEYIGPEVILPSNYDLLNSLGPRQIKLN